MAETRETQVLEDVINETEIENPRTTEEAILAQVVAGEEVTINARTRLQKYLSQLTSGGSSVIVEPLSVTENGTIIAPDGTAYSPVTVAVPNPNSRETIIGTMANPFGSYTVDNLAYKANVENSINMFIVMDGSSLGLGVYPLSQLKPLNHDDDDMVIFGAAYFPSDSSNSMAADLEYNANGLFSAKIMRGIVTPTDMSPYATQIQTTLTIIHHPLPEDNT